MCTTEIGLRGARILILEDDYYLADDLQAAVENAGGVTVGPFADERAARDAVVETMLDFAFVDVNLGCGPSFAVAEALLARHVPFVFVTGYDAGTIPHAFAGVPRLEKPLDARAVLKIVLQLRRR